MKYNNVEEMLIDMGDESFYVRFMKIYRKVKNIHPITVKMMDRRHLRIYQSRRFYVDELPEQRLARESWFQKRDNEYFIKDVIIDTEKSRVNIDTTYWINRWLKRK